MEQKQAYSAIHHPETQQYRVALEGGYDGVVGYKLQGSVLTLDHSEVPVELRGKGYASVLVETVLKQILADGYTVIPTCSYIVHYVERHPEWQSLLAN